MKLDELAVLVGFEYFSILFKLGLGCGKMEAKPSGSFVKRERLRSVYEHDQKSA